MFASCGPVPTVNARLYIFEVFSIFTSTFHGCLPQLVSVDGHCLVLFLNLFNLPCWGANVVTKPWAGPVNHNVHWLGVRRLALRRKDILQAAIVHLYHQLWLPFYGAVPVPPIGCKLILHLKAAVSRVLFVTVLNKALYLVHSLPVDIKRVAALLNQVVLLIVSAACWTCWLAVCAQFFVVFGAGVPLLARISFFWRPVSVVVLRFTNFVASLRAWVSLDGHNLKLLLHWLYVLLFVWWRWRRYGWLFEGTLWCLTKKRLFFTISASLRVVTCLPLPSFPS